VATNSRKRAVVVQHVASEGPGPIAPAPAAAAAEVRVVRVDRDEPLPQVAQLHVLVVLGGPMGALDDHSHPAGEHELIAGASGEADRRSVDGLGGRTATCATIGRSPTELVAG
jgi:hypothetical protein